MFGIVDSEVLPVLEGLRAFDMDPSLEVAISNTIFMHESFSSYYS